MNQKSSITIAIDAMGGENSPAPSMISQNANSLNDIIGNFFKEFDTVDYVSENTHKIIWRSKHIMDDQRRHLHVCSCANM